MDEFKNRDDAWAGLLNGAMLTLLGAGFPVLFIWRVVTHWQDLAHGPQFMTAPEAVQGAVTVSVSFWLLRLGARLLRRAAVALGKR